jgi:glycosyltransferase involved in cell wall biosynthesis
VTTGILLDVTRTVSRAGQGAATGIDRVERAWIDAALDGRWGPAWFVARTGSGVHAVGSEAMRALLAALDGTVKWPPLDLRGLVSLKSPPAVRRIASAMRRAEERPPAGLVYANVGHANLTKGTVTSMRAAGARRVVVKLHDVIPLDHPEFARANGPQKMRERLEAAATADALIYNSHHTRSRAEAHLSLPDGVVAPLGIDVEPAPEAPAHDGFVVLGTIEPRKNHLLLLDLWSALGDDAPPLHIIGRRGWMNEALFARLDRNPLHVTEHGSLPDEEAQALLGGACALLFPSLAEGYGLPVAEALTLHVPVIASDLPALREVGGDLAIWCSPEDPSDWLVAVREMRKPDLRAARAATIRASWKPPRWEDHFTAADLAISGQC